MDSEDFDNLLKLFDYALSSDNPAVKKALKNLLLVVSIVEPQEEATGMSPLKEIKMELQRLRAEISVLQNNIRTPPYISPYNPNIAYPTTAPFPGTYPNTNPWTGYNPRIGVTSITSTATSGSGPSMPGAFSTYNVSSSSLNSELLAQMIKERDLDCYFGSIGDEHTESKE